MANQSNERPPSSPLVPKPLATSDDCWLLLTGCSGCHTCVSRTHDKYMAAHVANTRWQGRARKTMGASDANMLLAAATPTRWRPMSSTPSGAESRSPYTRPTGRRHVFSLSLPHTVSRIVGRRNVEVHCHRRLQLHTKILHGLLCGLLQVLATDIRRLVCRRLDDREVRDGTSLWPTRRWQPWPQRPMNSSPAPCRETSSTPLAAEWCPTWAARPPRQRSSLRSTRSRSPSSPKQPPFE